MPWPDLLARTASGPGCSSTSVCPGGRTHARALCFEGSDVPHLPPLHTGLGRTALRQDQTTCLATARPLADGASTDRPACATNHWDAPPAIAPHPRLTRAPTPPPCPFRSWTQGLVRVYSTSPCDLGCASKSGLYRATETDHPRLHLLWRHRKLQRQASRMLPRGSWCRWEDVDVHPSYPDYHVCLLQKSCGFPYYKSQHLMPDFTIS